MSALALSTSAEILKYLLSLSYLIRNVKTILFLTIVMKIEALEQLCNEIKRNKFTMCIWSLWMLASNFSLTLTQILSQFHNKYLFVLLFLNAWPGKLHTIYDIFNENLALGEICPKFIFCYVRCYIS